MNERISTVHQDRIQARRIEQEEQSKAGLSDIDGNWQAPHKFHNDGKEIYFGFSDFRKGGGYDRNKILLLRFVSSIDPNFGSFPPDEGGDISKTLRAKMPHIHIVFKQ